MILMTIDRYIFQLIYFFIIVVIVIYYINIFSSFFIIIIVVVDDLEYYEMERKIKNVFIHLY